MATDPLNGPVWPHADIDPRSRALWDDDALDAVADKRRGRVGLLSPRERQVLLLQAAGLRNHEIGQVLYLSVETVKTHVRNILYKLNVRTTTAAVGRAYRAGDFADTHGLAAAIAVMVAREETLDGTLLDAVRTLTPPLAQYDAWKAEHEADDA